MPGWLLGILLAVYVAAAVGLVAVFLLEPDDSTFVGSCVAFFQDEVPQRLERLARRWLPSSVIRCGEGTWDYCVNKRNPILQVFYVFILGGAYTAFVVAGHPHIPNAYLGAYHKASGAACIALCVGSWYLACSKHPGRVEPGEEGKWDACYEADGVLYPKDRHCETCDCRRPARAKHCRICGYCVPRFDHHCPWVNTCVGQENVPFFLLFLATHCAMLWYGTVVIGLIFWSIIDEKKLFEAVFFSSRTKKQHRATAAIVSKYLLSRYAWLAGVGLLAVVMALVLTGFFGYHVYLACTNQTTNEVYKWKDVRRWWAAATAAAEAAAKEAAEAPPEEEPPAGAEKEPPAGAEKEPPAEVPQHPGPLPTNMYDRGVLANLGEVLYPLSWRQAGPKGARHRVPEEADASDGAGAAEGEDGKAQVRRRRNRRKKKSAS